MGSFQEGIQGRGAHPLGGTVGIRQQGEFGFQPTQFPFQGIAVHRFGGVRFQGLHGPALDELPLAGEQGGERVLPSGEGLQVGRYAEQPADEIIEMRGQRHQQVSLVARLFRDVGPGRQQPSMQQ